MNAAERLFALGPLLLLLFAGPPPLPLPLGLDPTRETMKRTAKPFVVRRFQANPWLTPQRI